MVVLALMPFAASAQSVTASGFQVQNLNESQQAAIVITYYNGDGTVNATQNAVVPAGGSLTFFNGQGGTVAMSATAGFRGSVVISSDQPIAAITNLIGTNVGGSYDGFSTGNPDVSVPLITRDNFGVSTSLTIQNTGAAATTATVTYNPGVAGNTGQTDSATIQPGASVTFSQADKTGLGIRFVGSASISAPGGSIVAIVNQEGNSQLLTYNAFTGGGSTIAVPLLVANNFGALTGLQIQNNGATPATVSVTYSPNAVTTAPAPQAVCATPPAKTGISLAAGASTTLIQAGGAASEGFDDFFATCRYVGGATITATGGTVVAIVNQIAGTSASAYESFSTAAATGTTKVPLAMANNFGAFTGIQVQNVGGAPANVTVAYGPNTLAAGAGICGTPTAKSATIAAGGSFTFIQSGVGAEADGFDPQFATCRYVGSATITAPGGQIVAIVNQAGAGAGDSLFTYNAFNQ
jgi:hypothetical protein